MPECQNCGRYFHISHRTCPKCGEYEAPEDEFLHYARSKAESELETGTELYVVRKQLIESGLVPEHADSVVADAVDRISSGIRRQGVKRIVSGAAITVGSTISVFAFLLHRPGLIATYSAAAFAVVAMYGVKAIGSGVYSLISGRDLSQQVVSERQ